jgi:ABC-type transport system involved in multi-copper enzyme maturation permease subunit
VVGLELMAACFIAPGLTAGAISSEREHQTFDLLRTTLLSARSVVWGKFLAAFLYLLLLIFAALPIQSLAFLFGGVSLEEMLISTLMLVLTSMTFCAVGLFFSSLLARTLVSTVLAYAFAILWVFGLPFIIMLFSGLFGAIFNSSHALFNTTTAQVVLFFGGWVLVSLNPLGAAIGSEAILLNDGSLFLFDLPLPNGTTLHLISPWVIYVIASFLISLLLLWLSVRFVRRAEK